MENLESRKLGISKTFKTLVEFTSSGHAFSCCFKTLFKPTFHICMPSFHYSIIYASILLVVDNYAISR